MSKKKFREAPQPHKENTLSSKQIVAFEKNGIGQDQRPQNSISSNADIKLVRINVDLPSDEHRRFKTACAANSTTMVAELKRFIEIRIVDLESGK